MNSVTPEQLVLHSRLISNTEALLTLAKFLAAQRFTEIASVTMKLVDANMELLELLRKNRD